MNTEKSPRASRPKITGIDVTYGNDHALVYIGFSDGSGYYLNGPYYSTDPEGARKFSNFIDDAQHLVAARRALTL